MVVTPTTLRINGWSQVLPLAQITHLSAEANYSWIHLQNGRKYLSSRSLLYLQERLPLFVRVHRRYLINPSFIVQVQVSKGSATLQLSTGLSLPVSRRRLEAVTSQLRALSATD